MNISPFHYFELNRHLLDNKVQNYIVTLKMQFLKTAQDVRQTTPRFSS